MEKKELPLIKTTDLNLASTLLSIGFEILTIDNRNPKRANFYFKKTPLLLQKIESYWNRELKVSPLDIFNSRKEILGRVFGNEGLKEQQS